MVWAAEAVCERPGSPAGLQCALCPRGVVRLLPGVERAAAIGRLCGSGRSSEAAVRRTFRLLPPLLLVAARWVGALAGCSDSGI